MSGYTLLTGPTGLLGRYILRDLLIAGHRVAVVARPGKKETVAQRIEAILQPWEAETGKSLPRPVCFAGDITKEFLGLDNPSRQWISQHCSSMLHNAAALKFYEEADGEPWRTNVEGTRHVLQLCQDTGIKQMHYVSTAYVSGTRDGRIMENTLDLGQSFRNDYEKSKLQAETLVRNDKNLEQVTVYRPAVIAGDSRTGYTNTYHGLFMYLQLMSVLARNTEPGPDGIRNTSLQLNITGDEPRNVIPVDWTSEVITHLIGTPESHGQTFHLAPRVRMTARHMIEAGYTYFNSTGVEFVGPTEECPEEGMERDAYQNSMMYREYEASDPEFDTTNLDRFAGHLPCPTIDEPMLHRFMAFGEEDRWGKRRTKSVNVAIQMEQYLEDLLQADFPIDEESTDQHKKFVGLNVLGSGGGQWTIALRSNQLIGFKPGINSDCSKYFSIDSSVFDTPSTDNVTDQQVELTRHWQETTTNRQCRLAGRLAEALFPSVSESC